MASCAVVECEQPAREAGYCWSHWARWEAFGDPLATRRFYRHPDKLRLLAAVREDAETGCWNWTRFLDEEGYGLAPLGGRSMKAHRAVYIALNGPILTETLDHLCRNRACVNPDHLEPVSMRENTLRGETIAAGNAAKTHCPQGHGYSFENTSLVDGGKRRCRICRNEQSRASKAKRRRRQRELV